MSRFLVVSMRVKGRDKENSSRYKNAGENSSLPSVSHSLYAVYFLLPSYIDLTLTIGLLLFTLLCARFASDLSFTFRFSFFFNFALFFAVWHSLIIYVIPRLNSVSVYVIHTRDYAKFIFFLMITLVTFELALAYCYIGEVIINGCCIINHFIHTRTHAHT